MAERQARGAPWLKKEPVFTCSTCSKHGLFFNITVILLQVILLVVINL